MTQQDLTVTTRVYYTGDIANHDGFGTITATHSSRWGQSVDITLDDGREIKGISTHNIGTSYNGTCDPRFVTQAAYRSYKVAKLSELYGHI